tara:strand:+ start:3244 stop:3501 length:258 start_codon:yes stop_codon:yes gene_type:complete
MPIYEYYCKDCENTFTAFHSMSSDWEGGCGICESKNITRVIPELAHSIKKDKFKKKAGDVVKSHIEEAKRDLKQEKRKVKEGMLK